MLILGVIYNNYCITMWTIMVQFEQFQ